VTIDLKARLAKMQTDFPHELKVHYLFNGDAEREHELHECFKFWHYRAEWFRTWKNGEPIRQSLDDEWQFGEAHKIIENHGVIC
jgi:hypothetical protein